MTEKPFQQLDFPGFNDEHDEEGVPRPASEARAARVTDFIPGPPSCNTGGKLAWTERNIGVDWLRVSFAPGDGHIARLTHLLDEAFGLHDECHGRHGYQGGCIWSSGAMIWFAQPGEKVTDPNASVCVELNGGSLAKFEDHKRFEFCREVVKGGKCRRLDLALDFFHDEEVGLITSMLHAANEGKMCKYRSWQPQLHYGAGNELTGYGVVFGGRKSDRNCTVYDKGLESGKKPRGQWERLEMRWHKDAAMVAAQTLFQANAYFTTAFNMVIGGLEFRELGTGNDQHLNRRAICDFWQQVAEGGTPTPCVTPRYRRTLDRFATWINNSVAPTLRVLCEYTLDANKKIQKRREAMPDISVLLSYLLEGRHENVGDYKGKKRLLQDLNNMMNRRPLEVPF